MIDVERPTRKQWSGPEDGLPPVGEDCEYCDCENGWVLTHILSHHPNGDCAWHQSVRADGFVDGRSFSTDGASSFRPLKSEKERVVEAVIRKMGWTNSVESVLEDLYDVGALKMPEEDQ